MQRPARFELLVLVVALALGNGACSPSSADLERWQTSPDGSAKLAEVVVREGTSMPLRVEAALMLVRMQPREGKAVGLPTLLEALVHVPGASRARLLADLARPLSDGMLAPAPPRPRFRIGGPELLDLPAVPRTPDKDAAFALLAADPPIGASPSTLGELRAALTEWCVALLRGPLTPDAATTLAPVVRVLGAPAAARFSSLLNEASTHVDRIGALIAEAGDDATKQEAVATLIPLARTIDTREWLERQAAVVQAADEDIGFKLTNEQLQVQVARFQEMQLTRAFSALGTLRTRPAIDYLFDYATKKANPAQHRRAALSTLHEVLPKDDASDVHRLDAITIEEPPPEKTSLGKGRVGELDGIVDVGPITATVPVSDATRVFATLKAGLRRCFRVAPVDAPTLGGHLALTVKVAANGEVDSAEGAPQNDLPEPMVQCVCRKVRNAQFEPPGPKGSTLKVTLAFVAPQM